MQQKNICQDFKNKGIFYTPPKLAKYFKLSLDDFVYKDLSREMEGLEDEQS